MRKIEELNYLLQKRKFADSEWLKRGLNPSSQDLCETLEKDFNKCLISLIDLIEKSSSKYQLKKQLQKSLKSIWLSVSTHKRLKIPIFDKNLGSMLNTVGN